MTIKLEDKEVKKLETALDVLEEYSRIYSAIVRNKEGMFFNEAGTAANSIRKIIEQSKTA